MFKVNCSELSGVMKLALAEAISGGLGGSGVALLDGDYVAIDTLSGPEIGAVRIRSLVGSYLSSRSDASVYHLEEKGDSIIVHSSAPVSAREKRVVESLPPGLLQCPDCGYLTTSEEKYEDHLRMHDLMRGIAR